MNDTKWQGSAQLLRGNIENLNKTRCQRDFVFNAGDRTKMGATAIAAGLAGLGGTAAGLGNMAMDTMEEADLLEFHLNDKLVRAWVWVSVFNEGDEVEVVAEPHGDGWMGYGIRRINDRIVALHPHCSRGRNAHYKASFSWFAKIVAVILVISWILQVVVLCLKSFPISEIGSFMLLSLAASGTASLVFGVVALRVSRRFMGFVRLAEDIFRGFGWQDVKNIDLPAITKNSKKPDDPAALGIFFFRY